MKKELFYIIGERHLAEQIARNYFIKSNKPPGLPGLFEINIGADGRTSVINAADNHMLSFYTSKIFYPKFEKKLKKRCKKLGIKYYSFYVNCE